MAEKLFGATFRDGRVLPFAISSWAKGARMSAGEAYMYPGRGDKNWRDGWKRAFKAGVRIRKIEVTVLEGN